MHAECHPDGANGEAVRGFRAIRNHGHSLSWNHGRCVETSPIRTKRRHEPVREPDFDWKTNLHFRKTPGKLPQIRENSAFARRAIPEKSVCPRGNNANCACPTDVLPISAV